MTSERASSRFKRGALRLRPPRFSLSSILTIVFAMSYASVAAHNAPPPSAQPHPDPALLHTPADAEAAAPADDGAKVNVVPSDFKEHPSTLTSEVADSIPPLSPSDSSAPPAKPSARKRAHDVEKKVEDRGLQLWGTIHEQLMRPAVAGGLLGVGSYPYLLVAHTEFINLFILSVNVGLLAGTAYAYYAQPHLRRDTKIISSTVVGGLVLLGGEGYLTEAYRKTAQGQEEERRAREEGSILYRHVREQILRPGVLGGLVGLGTWLTTTDGVTNSYCVFIDSQSRYHLDGGLLCIHELGQATLGQTHGICHFCRSSDVMGW